MKKVKKILIVMSKILVLMILIILISMLIFSIIHIKDNGYGLLFLFCWGQLLYASMILLGCWILYGIILLIIKIKNKIKTDHPV